MKISQLYKQFTKVKKGIKKPANKAQSKKTNIPKSKTGLWNKQLNRVIVPSNRITMKGPNGEKDFFKRPVLGKGLQTGKTVVMQPGKEYKFPGDKEVLETRMQDGGLSRRQIYRDVSAEVDRQTEALNTPEYKKLLQTEFYGPGSEDMPVQDMIDARRLNLDQLRVDVPYMSFMNFGPSTHAKYKPSDHSILLKRDKYNPSFFRHELSHSLDSSSTPGANKVGDYFTQVLSQDLNRPKNASSKNKEYEYLSDPSEVKARLKALRDSSIDQGYQLLQPGYDINTYKEGFSPGDKAQYQQLQDVGLSDDDINKYMYLFAKEDVAKQKIAQDGAEIPVDIDALYSRYQKDTRQYMQDGAEVPYEESLYNRYQWESQPDNVTYKKVNQTSPTRYKFNSALSEGGDKETQMMQKWLNDTYNVYLPENGVLDTKTQSAIDRYVKNQDAVRRSEIDPNLFSGMPEGFSFKYDDKGSLQAKSSSAYHDEFKDWKTIEKLNPTFAEFEDLIKRVPKYNQYYETIYDVDTKLRGEQQGPLTEERARELAALKQYQDLPEDYKKYLGQTLGNLPVVEGSRIYEGYSPNRIWTTPPSKDSRPWLGDSEAYDPETQPRYLYFISPKEGTKWTSEEIAAQEENMGCISGNCGDEYYTAGILAPKPKLELNKETPNAIPTPTGQTWNLGKQMLVEMLNNPEIMEYASKNNINLTDFAKEQYSPVLAESLVAARDANFNDKGLVVPHSRDYSPVIQNPDEFNLAGYLPITMDMFNPSVSPDKSNKQRYTLNWADNREEYLRRAGVPEDQWDKVYIHTSPFPINEYQPREYQKNFQSGGSVETSTEENPERMNPIEINVQRRPWWKRTLRKIGVEVDPQYRDPNGFAGQMARRLSDATGGENWYKSENDIAGSFAQILTSPLTVPQLGMMYGLTGKVQTPSEAMDIENPYLAFATDIVLDPGTIVGAASAAPKLTSKAAGSLAKLARRSATSSLDDVARPALRTTTPTSRVIDDVVRETSTTQPRQLDLFEGVPQSQTTTSRGFISGSDPNSVRVKSRPAVVNQSNFEMGSPKLSAEQREIARSMTPAEYRNTVTDVYGRLKPTAPDQRLPGVLDIPREEYIDIFNRNLDALNDEIIPRNNVSGLEYRVTGLNPRGDELTFYTPRQKATFPLNDFQSQRLDLFNSNPNRYLDELIEEGSVQRMKSLFPNDPDLFNYTVNDLTTSGLTKDELMKTVGDRYNRIVGKTNIIEGPSEWGVTTRPGLYRGDIPDIPNKAYLRSIPGMQMSNSAAGVFPKESIRIGEEFVRGTRSYQSLNDYLKRLDLGRVSSGMNTQSPEAFGFWKSALEKGKATGFHGGQSSFNAALYQDGGMTVPGVNGTVVSSSLYDKKKQYKSGGQHGGLDRWFAEKWVDVKSGKQCGRQEGENRAYPACRPSKRVSSKTPKTSSELSSTEKAKFKASKTSSTRIPYNHKRKK